MRAQGVRLPWGDEELEVPLPEQWRIAGIVEPGSLPGVKDAADETRRGLCEPIGCPRLRDTVRRGMRIVILIDDATRPTPVHVILPQLLEELQQAGVGTDGVTLITALGVHRPMRPEEIAQRVGPELMPRLRWENHDCDDTSRLVYLGTTARQTPVWMNTAVAQADVVISIGCIEPHVIASFSGGYKNVLPGVVGRETVARNHALNCTPQTVNMVGRPIERNPMRLDLEEGAQMLRRSVFIVNVVLNGALQTVHVVCGDPIAAHRAGVQTSAALCGVAISARADVVIAASHPMDQDLRQGVKALANTLPAVRPGGVHLTFARAREGLGLFGVAHHRLPGVRHFGKLLAPRLLQLMPRLRLLGLGEEDRFFAYFGLQAMRRTHQLMYAPTVPTSVWKRLPFIQFTESPADAIRSASRWFPRAADVLIFPHGGVTYPVLPDD